MPSGRRGNRLIGIITETDILDFVVDVFGLKMKGTRLTLALEDAPGVLHGVLEIMKTHAPTYQRRDAGL